MPAPCRTTRTWTLRWPAILHGRLPCHAIPWVCRRCKHTWLRLAMPCTNVGCSCGLRAPPGRKPMHAALAESTVALVVVVVIVVVVVMVNVVVVVDTRSFTSAISSCSFSICWLSSSLPSLCNCNVPARWQPRPSAHRNGAYRTIMC